MKKVYSTPEAKVIIIQTTQMIAESFGKNSSTAVDPSGNNVLSRDGRSSWDDDDE